MEFKLTKILCVVFSVSLVFSSVSIAGVAEASTVSDLKDEKEEIQEEIDDLEEQLAELEDEQDEQEAYVATLQAKVSLQQDKLDTLNDEMDALESAIETVKTKIATTEAEIVETQEEIDEKQAEFEEVYEEYCQRLRAMYISGTASTLEIFLSSGDMSTILTRAEMVKRVSQQDNATLDELMQKMEEIEEKKQELEEKKQELSDSEATLEEQEAELQSSIDEVAELKSELSAEIAECNAAIEALADTASEIQETIDENEEEVAAIEAEIAAAAVSTSVSSDSYTAGSGVLGYPTSSRTITAGYPYYSNGSYHGGIDFQCSVGTPVYASDSGYVAIAKSLTYSYGVYILINHGNGLSTLYAHLSSLCVSAGQAVEKGDLIGYSGQSGNATGPHLHFEVRLNGTRVNPLSYLG